MGCKCTCTLECSGDTDREIEREEKESARLYTFPFLPREAIVEQRGATTKNAWEERCVLSCHFIVFAVRDRKERAIAFTTGACTRACVCVLDYVVFYYLYSRPFMCVAAKGASLMLMWNVVFRIFPPCSWCVPHRGKGGSSDLTRQYATGSSTLSSTLGGDTLQHCSQ